MKYKGQLEGFPFEVVERMKALQVEQGNKEDVSVFEKNRSAGFGEGGFSWEFSIEKIHFWGTVMDEARRKNFSTFFERYPKEGKGEEEAKRPVLSLGDELLLVFRNKEGQEKTLTITVTYMLEKALDDLYEDLEEKCTSSGCNNESQDFCDCGAQYEDFKIKEIRLL